MKSLRSKLILTLIAISLLPVFPVYYVVKSLLQQSLHVGYNENVQLALDNAAGLSKELFNQYKKNTVEKAKTLAGQLWLVDVFGGNNAVPPDDLLHAGEKIELYDLTGKHIYTLISNDNQTFFPELYDNQVKSLAMENSAALIAGSGSAEFITAYAPVRSKNKRIGTLVLTWQLDSLFVNSSNSIIEVNQIFRTLNIFEGTLTEGFLLSFIVVYLPIAALSVFMGVYFSRRLTSPLTELVRGTERVAAGDWQYRVEVHSKDEVGQLVRAFNEMVTTIKEKQDQVVSLEKMAAWREMARVLAHEIKNPLTPIQLTVQQLKDKYDNADDDYSQLLRECTDIIRDEIETLRKLAMEFSDFARMPELNREPGNLNDMIAEVRKLYPNDNIALQLNKELGDCACDWAKLRRLLINLIENSLDSIAEKGNGDIRIETRKTDSSIVLLFNDSGAGMSEEVQAKIFEPYFSTKKSGMGLGMAIVKHIVTEHGGTVQLDSREEVGTKFVITLPIKNFGSQT